MDSSLRLVSDRFDHVRERAALLFEHDESFRDLCEDYEACAQAVTRLESAASSPDDLRHEYAALLLRLERELLRYLEEHPDCNGKPPRPVK
jgi:hypothetical protein